MAEILFRAPSREDATELLRSVAPACRTEGELLHQSMVWLDTFDWRLARRDRVLRWREEAGVGRLLFGTVDGEPLRSLEIDRAPRWAAEVPASPLRRDLERWTEPRRLLVLAEGRRRGRRWHWLDSRRKTIATLSAETLRVRREGAPRFAESLAQVRVTPVRGCEEEARKLAKRLAKAGLERVAESQFELVMSAVGRMPVDYSSKFVVELSGEDRADVAMVSLHRYLLEKIEANHEGAVADLDPEFLHDLRVSVRRTRSLLGQVRGVFPQRSVESFKKGFRWVQGFTGPVRDLHVWLLAVPELRQRLAPRDADGLMELEHHLVGLLESEHRRLGRTLEGKRYMELLRRWRAFLEQPRSEGSSRRGSSLANAGRPIIDVASKRIWRVYRRMLAEGEAIVDDSPPESLHALRIRGKKLRYLLEAFRSLYPRAIENEIKTLKRLQDNLGDFNDCAVQRRALADFREQIGARGALRPDTVRAFDSLETDIDLRAASLRRRFAEEFALFATTRQTGVYRQLFKAKPGKMAKSGKKTKPGKKAKR